MGSITYGFLADSILFHEKNLQNDFKDVTVDRLEREIQEYRQFCIDNFDDLIGEIKGRDSFLKVFSHQGETPLNLLKQTALYVDQFIISDPIFALSEKRSEMADVSSKYLGFDKIELSKETLSTNARFLKEITPMVAADYVKIFPKSFYFERPEGIPITVPRDYHNDILPREVLHFLRSHAKVQSLQKCPDGGWRVMDELSPCRSIIVEFEEEVISKTMIFYLFETEILSVNKETGIVSIRQSLPDSIPDRPYFDAWVNQSLNSTAKSYFDHVFIESALSASLNATYLSDSVLAHKLLTENLGAKETIETYTASQLLNFELPFIENIDVKKLMTIREFEADTFTNFRIELERNFRELRALTDEKQIKQKIENIFHELRQVQGQKINQKVGNLRKQLGINTLIAIGGLAGSVVTSGFSLGATALAIGKGFKDYFEYREKMKENPAYLLWKVRK